MLNKFFLDLLEHIGIVLFGHIDIILYGSFHDIITAVFEFINHLAVTLILKTINSVFNTSVGFFFEFIASVASHHFSLVRQIQIFLLFNDFPTLLYKHWQSINGNVLLFFIGKE